MYIAVKDHIHVYSCNNHFTISPQKQLVDLYLETVDLYLETVDLYLETVDLDLGVESH